MIIDKDNLFSDGQAVTATAVSTNAIDLGEAGDAIGQELTIHVVVSGKDDFATLTSLTVQVQTSETGVTTPTDSYTDVLLSAAIPVASLKAGKEVFTVRVPQGLKRYVRLKYTVTGSNATKGKITAFASKDL